MSLDIWYILAWCEVNIFIPAWSWLNIDFMGLPFYSYIFAIALAGYAGTWAVKRFKNVYHERYDDYFDIANANVEAEIHKALSSTESRLNFSSHTGFGERWTESDFSDNIPVADFEDQNGAWFRVSNKELQAAKKPAVDPFSDPVVPKVKSNQDKINDAFLDLYSDDWEQVKEAERRLKALGWER